MKKLISACLAATALASLSGCSTVNEENTAATPGTINSGPQSLVSTPGEAITTTQPLALPKPAGSP